MKGKILNHIGITINEKADIKNFYADILGFETKDKFTLSKILSKQIFGIDKDTEIVVTAKKNFIMELFIATEANHRNFQHICITVDNRDEVIKKTKKNNYPCTVIKRDTSDIVFIQDRSNNSFEIK